MHQYCVSLKGATAVLSSRITVSRLNKDNCYGKLTEPSINSLNLSSCHGRVLLSLLLCYFLVEVSKVFLSTALAPI